MKLRNKILLGVGVVVAAVCTALVTYQPSVNITPPVHNACDVSLWQHVYHPQRLQVRKACQTVSGMITKVKVEPDGDSHLLLRLDSQYQNLLTVGNLRQGNNMVLEPICVNSVTQADAVSSCKGFINKIKIPKVGQHVTVTGSYLLDKDHGLWAEIHPLSKLEIIP
jgi:hypothetical protein